MSHVDLQPTKAPEHTSVDELAALLDPTAMGKVLDDREPEDWCAFGEA